VWEKFGELDLDSKHLIISCIKHTSMINIAPVQLSQLVWHLVSCDSMGASKFKLPLADCRQTPLNEDQESFLRAKITAQLHLSWLFPT